MTTLIRPLRVPTPTRLSSGVLHALGFGLVETLLVLAGLSAMSAVALVSYQHVSAKAKVSDESDSLRELSQRVDNSFGLLGSFEGVSASAIVRDGLAPTRLTRGEGLLTNAWGGPVTVEPYTVTRFGDGFSIVHHQVPARSCADFVAANARDPWDVQVSDVSVIRNHGGRLDVEALADACAEGDGRVAFVYHTGLVAGAAVAASPLQLPHTPPAVSVPTSSTPLGGPVGPSLGVGPTTGMAPIVPAPVAPTAPSVPYLPSPSPVVVTTPMAPPPSPPTNPPTTVAACVENVENRTVDCPSGSVGQVFQSRRHHCGPDSLVYEAWDRLFTTAWTETRNTCSPCPAPESRSLSCPSGQVGTIEEARAFVCSGLGSWGAWMQSSNTCAACPAPEIRTLSCPAGQWGAIEEQRSFVCSGNGSWGSWAQTSNTCAPACVLPSPSTQTDDETRTVSQRLECPAGQSGDLVQSRQERRIRTRSAHCPAPTGAYAWSGWSEWTAWEAVTSWGTVTNTCAPTAGACTWEIDSITMPPNFGSLDGASVHYNDGLGGGCSGAWGARSGGITDQSAFNACRNSIPIRPLNASADYSTSDYTNWGGGMEITYSYRASCAVTWKWVMTEDNSGGCGAQGGGSGGEVCGSSLGGRNGYGCGGEVCNATYDGVSYSKGYAERLDAPQPACDYQVYTCMEVSP